MQQIRRRRCELVSLCSRDVAAITDVWNLLERELEVNTEELEVTSRKNAEMVYVLSTAIPTLKGLLNSVRVRLTTDGSRPSDHYFRSVFWFVCLFVCLFVQSFSQPSLIRFRSN